MGLTDAEIVSRQLKRKITNMNRVVKRCSFGYPVVIESLPVKDGRPFPTLYWLTCPHLRREISKLEERGYVRYFEDIIEKDESFRERLFKAHEEIVKRRENLINDEDLKKILRKVGSGGISDWTKVKCLHLHVADFLAGIDNPVGEAVMDMIEKRECDDGVCRDIIDPR